MKQISNHIINGLRYAVPFIILFSISYALSTNWILPAVIPDAFFFLIVPVLTAFIAQSIIDKIVFVPAFILGILMTNLNIGFFGGIIGGLLIGYIAYLICSKVNVSHTIWNFIVGYIVIGGLSFGLSYVLMYFLVGPPIRLLLETIQQYVLSIGTNEILLLIGVLAILTTVDLGGPFNKIAFGFILEFFLDGMYHITGPVLIAVATPPLAIYIALKLYPNRFDEVDQSSRKLALIGGLFAMTEGAIQVSYRRPLRVIPIVVLGSLLGSLFAGWFGLENILLVGGILGVFSVNNVWIYLAAHAIGVSVIVGLLALTIPKKPLLESQERV